MLLATRQKRLHMDAQAYLSLRWAHSHFVGLLVLSWGGSNAALHAHAYMIAIEGIMEDLVLNHMSYPR